MNIWRYFGEAPPPSAEDAGKQLWNTDITTAGYDASTQGYQAAIMEQYKLYVELADRISARRAFANSFFLTLNTSIFTAIGVFWKGRPQVSEWMLALPLAVLLIQCATWFWIIRSYRQLNSGKWAVVGALEAHLPASPYWKAEWEALGRGRDPARYWPLTHIEQWVPWLFAVAYLGGFIIAIAT